MVFLENAGFLFFGKLQKQKAKGIIRNERLNAIFLFCHNEISSS